MFGARAFIISLAAWTVAGCGDFTPTKPFPCSTNGACPSGFRCDQASRLCYANGQQPDSGSGDVPTGTGDATDSSNNADVRADQPGADGPVDTTPDISPDADAKIDVPMDAPIEVALDVPPVDSNGDASKVPNGGACTGASECQSQFCVDGVCCDGACNGTCVACTNALTGQATGKCSPVKAGTAHGNDCTASDPSTCGLNGKCDGAGACQKYAAGTMCKGESCAVGTATYSPMSTCNAQGACTPMNRACANNLKCAADGVRCRSNCGSDIECVDAAYCDGALCVVDQNPGALCARSEQCTSNLCSGRCCNAGVPCKCPQPDGTNTVRNAGLDKTAQDWALQGDPADGNRWDTEDADSCPFSGSVNIVSDDGFPLQCVQAQPSTMYNFGAWFKVASNGLVDLCQIVFYEDFRCQGTALGFFNLNVGGTKNAWIQASMSVQSPALTQYASIGCSGANFKMDKMFLSRAPATF